MKSEKNELSAEQQQALLTVLKTRFEKNLPRHGELEWSKVQARLLANPKKIWSLKMMEETGGEPDVVGHDEATGEFIFYDCSTESPKGRRSLCYDHAAWESRKKYKPADNAVNVAASMGIELLTE